MTLLLAVDLLTIKLSLPMRFPGPCFGRATWSLSLSAAWRGLTCGQLCRNWCLPQGITPVNHRDSPTMCGVVAAVLPDRSNVGNGC